MIVIGFLGTGLISLTFLPLELMPKSEKNILSVVTKYPGNSPSKIEELITRPIENQSILVGGIEKMHSSSEEGESRVTLYFNEDISMRYKAVELKSKIAFVKDKFPRDVEEPYIVKFNPNDNAMMILNINSKTLSLKQLRELTENSVKKYIERIDGVGEVIVSGGRFREINIDINNGRIVASKISLSDIMNTLRITNRDQYLGKLIDNDLNEISLRIKNRIKDISEIENLIIPLNENGSYVQIKDIANVYDGERDLENITREKGIENVSVYIKKNGDANVINTCSRIREELNNLNLNNSIISISYDQSGYIESAISSVSLSAYLGAFACSIVILYFLSNIPLTLIVASTIPISIILSLAFFYFLNLSLNVMSMAGLVLGIGILIDNSIVMVERISVHRVSSSEGNIDTVVDKSISNLWKELLASSLTNIVVFIPLFFISKELRNTFSDLAISVTICVLISYFLAIIWIPTVIRLVKIDQNFIDFHNFVNVFSSDIFSKRNKIFSKKLKFFNISFPMIVFSLISFLGIAAVILIDKEYIDIKGRKELRASVELKTGTNLETTSQLVKEVEKILLTESEIKSIDSKVEKWHADLYIKLHEEGNKTKIAELKNYLKQKVDHLTDVFVYFFDGDPTSSSNEIDIDIIGDDFNKLKDIAREMADTINKLPETSSVVFRFRDGKKEHHLVLQKEKHSISGLTSNEISDHMKTAIQGSIPTKLFEKNKEVDLRVRFRKEDRDTFNEILQTSLITNQNPISISEIVNVKKLEGETKIYRRNKRRMVTITVSFTGTDTSSYVKKLDASLKQIQFPDNYYFEYGDSIEKLKKSQMEMLIFISFSIFLIYSVLAILFQSYSYPLLVIINVPFIILSVTFFLYLLNLSYNISVYIGFVMLSGLTINNSIMILEHFLSNNRSVNSNFSLYSKIIRAVKKRKRAMKMTSLTTGIAMFPSIFIQSEGSEFWKPMSIVIILGMSISYIFALKVFPEMLYFLEKLKSSSIQFRKIDHL